MPSPRSHASSKSLKPGEAEIRVNPVSGDEYISVFQPEVVSIAEMSREEWKKFKAELDAARPTEEEIRTNRWRDE